VRDERLARVFRAQPIRVPYNRYSANEIVCSINVRWGPVKVANEGEYLCVNVAPSVETNRRVEIEK